MSIKTSQFSIYSVVNSTACWGYEWIMMTSSNGSIFRVTGPLMFSLIFAWTNGWVNNGEADDLRCHRAHYDIILMIKLHICGPLCGKLPVTGGFPLQRVSNAKSVSISWRHDLICSLSLVYLIYADVALLKGFIQEPTGHSLLKRSDVPVL